MPLRVNQLHRAVSGSGVQRSDRRAVKCLRVVRFGRRRSSVGEASNHDSTQCESPKWQHRKRINISTVPTVSASASKEVDEASGR